MKNIIKIVFLIFTYSLCSAQITEQAHLLFSLKHDGDKSKKIVNENGTIYFYIKNQHFLYSPKENPIEYLKKEEIENLKFMDMSTFLVQAEEEKQRLIDKGKKEGRVEILTKNRTYKDIYIYERSCKKVSRYKVIWLEEVH